MYVKVIVDPKRDSANTYPPTVTFDSNGDVVTISLQDPDREIEIGIEELKRIVRKLED